jgi:hypothetical protein
MVASIVPCATSRYLRIVSCLSSGADAEKVTLLDSAVPGLIETVISKVRNSDDDTAEASALSCGEFWRFIKTSMSSSRNSRISVASSSSLRKCEVGVITGYQIVNY